MGSFSGRCLPFLACYLRGSCIGIGRVVLALRFLSKPVLIANINNTQIAIPSPLTYLEIDIASLHCPVYSRPVVAQVLGKLRGFSCHALLNCTLVHHTLKRDPCSVTNLRASWPALCDKPKRRQSWIAIGYTLYSITNRLCSVRSLRILAFYLQVLLAQSGRGSGSLYARAVVVSRTISTHRSGPSRMLLRLLCLKPDDPRTTSLAGMWAVRIGEKVLRQRRPIYVLNI